MASEEQATVVDLDHTGRGVARLEGKAVFVSGALPGEEVRLKRTRLHARFDEALLLEVIRPSPDRREPACAHFGRCGGCALQHFAPEAQWAAKHRELLTQLERIGQVTPREMLPALTGPLFGYRRRARLGVKYLAKSGRAIVGFRERTSPLLTDVRHCHVLASPVGELCEALGEMIGLLSINSRLPQIEVSIGAEVTVMVLRVLLPPTDADLAVLRRFAAQHTVEFWLQSGGRDSIVPLDASAKPLNYELPEFNVKIGFGPLDFVQVNTVLNERMVSRAIELLAPEPGESVLDLYCGVGNFTLPLGRRAAQVLGIEGEAALVAKARSNATANGLDNVQFATADLSVAPKDEPWLKKRFDRILLDPPRAGAAALLPFIAKSGAKRVVYISCHPASLARDAGVLVREHGYTLTAAGVMDMFPHTAHVESIAVFEPTR